MMRISKSFNLMILSRCTAGAVMLAFLSCACGKRDRATVAPPMKVIEVAPTPGGNEKAGSVQAVSTGATTATASSLKWPEPLQAHGRPVNVTNVPIDRRALRKRQLEVAEFAVKQQRERAEAAYDVERSQLEQVEARVRGTDEAVARSYDKVLAARLAYESACRREIAGYVAAEQELGALQTKMNGAAGGEALSDLKRVTHEMNALQARMAKMRADSNPSVPAVLAAFRQVMATQAGYADTLQANTEYAEAKKKSDATAATIEDLASSEAHYDKMLKAGDKK